MRLSSYILVVLAIGLVFATVANIIHDLQIQYPEVEVDTSWENEYDYTEELNESASGIKSRFDKIGDEDVGWFSQLTAGITAIPLAIIFIPVVIFKTMKFAVIIFSSVATDIGIPAFVQVFGVVAIIIVITFALLSFWHRWKA